jgi:hypothetical protein
MSQALAYCEEVKRNITLDEAHILYFQQEEVSRKRFTFRCADPRCRTMLQPLIVAALYDKMDIPGEKQRSPYYREHPSHPHINSCTWVNDRSKSPLTTQHEPTVSALSGSVLEDLGLIFKPKRPAGNGNHIMSESKLPSQSLDAAIADLGKKNESKNTTKPPTSKFMANVAAKYLRYTAEQRKAFPLSIEGIAKGTFFSICMPIQGFHPHYQNERIYHGKVRIAELTNVFFLRFQAKMSPTGDKAARNTIAEIKVTKKWLDENDRALAAVLHEVAADQSGAWCFFYTTTKITMNKANAQFTVDDSAHLAIIAEADIEVLAPSNM